VTGGQGRCRRTDLPTGKIFRRAFVKSTLATGFALAVRPVSAQTITTDAAGVEAGEVLVAVGEITIPAYEAMPQTAGSFPVVLIVQDIFGVHEPMKGVCGRFAKLGYVAIVPELYVRHGDVSQIADIGAIIRTVVGIIAKCPGRGGS